MLYFQWGFSAGHAMRQEHVYHIGDQIRWQATKDGSVLPWVYFWTRPGGKTVDQGANLGDPSIKNLLVRDPAQFFWEVPQKRRRCEGCGEPFEGAVLEIRENAIRGARIYSTGEYENDTNIFIFDPSGLVKPMPEWSDYPLGIVYDLLPSDQ